jgi:large conductance mechanosensitive channel
MGVLKEFREFVARGNVVDLAVGVVIGASFGKVVTSAVADVVTPPLGLVVGGKSFEHLKLVLREATDDKHPAVTLNYGLFLQNIFDFLIIAVAIFVLVKLVNRFHKKPPAGPPPISREVELLTEIRDALKKP